MGKRKSMGNSRNVSPWTSGCVSPNTRTSTIARKGMLILYEHSVYRRERKESAQVIKAASATKSWRRASQYLRGFIYGHCACVEHKISRPRCLARCMKIYTQTGQKNHRHPHSTYVTPLWKEHNAYIIPPPPLFCVKYRGKKTVKSGKVAFSSYLPSFPPLLSLLFPKDVYQRYCFIDFVWLTEEERLARFQASVE